MYRPTFGRASCGPFSLSLRRWPAPGRPWPSFPPILDRELFFGNPEIAAAQISPDGKYIAFLKPWKETGTSGQEGGGAVRRRQPRHRPTRSVRSPDSSGAATAG